LPKAKSLAMIPSLFTPLTLPPPELDLSVASLDAKSSLLNGNPIRFLNTSQLPLDVSMERDSLLLTVKIRLTENSSISSLLSIIFVQNPLDKPTSALSTMLT
jgi:hypothetical protein